VTLRDLPTLNALLNAASATALVVGFWHIRRGRWRAHRAAMLTAFGLSTAFLVSYLVYHAQVGSVRYQGQGFVRTVYFGVLLTHTVLAAAVPFLAAVTLVRALRERFPRHAAIARWTLPIWLYVSVTGVVIYLMLYGL
jgi:protein SCO1/2/putative membrane protein